MSPRTSKRLASALVVVALVPALVGFGTAVASWSVPLPSGAFGPRAFETILALVFAGSGWGLATRRPDNPIGWLFLFGAVSAGLQQLGDGYAIFAVAGHGATTITARLAAISEDWIWLPGVAALALVLCLFPDGRLVSKRWRPWVTICVVGSALCALGFALSDRPLEFPAIRNPLGVPGMVVVGFGMGTAFFGLLFLGLASLIVRFRRTGGDEHEQLKWPLSAAALVVAAFTVYIVGVDVIPGGFGSSFANALEVVITLGFLGIPVAIGIGVLKYRLYDIDIVIRKTVIYAILVGLILVFAGLAVAIVGVIVVGPVKDEPAALLAIGGILGLAVWPLRRLATRIADRVVFGGRRTPYEVVTGFADRLGETYSSDDVLPRIAQVVASGIGAETVVAWLQVGGTLRAATTFPNTAQPPANVPTDATVVRHQGEVLGAISVSMPANDPMNAQKEGLIRDLAAQAGPVLRNVRLLEELRDSRRRIVAAQDERARTLERNIHDGAQQQLVALAVKQRLAATLVGTDDHRVRSMLEELQAETNAALEDLRDLARGIYPPLLADKGLASALEAQARKATVPTTIESDGIDRYGQDVEAAVYFSCLEALQNIAKYADASRTTIRLARSDDHLSFEVTDDGRGFDPSTTTFGTGLQGMADRLAALGGKLDIRSEPGGGTTVEGALPVEAMS